MKWGCTHVGQCKDSGILSMGDGEPLGSLSGRMTL